ncbi:MAG: bifunctional adenosylcobinamide kinase/adenosylcobinamide-phosphate guanylyltransferase [Oscillospiraceae bacterium]|nr:bifunctional adenosylcobinamide kinase/adenosylcobinamide-phosphate guanylyltransferase [Oscillospiraceae bacterium]
MKILVLGGAASGKSELAENMIIARGGAPVRYYIATMTPFDEEGRARVEKHRAARRERGFITIERYTDIGSLDFPDGARGDALLEDIGNLVANEMFGESEKSTAAAIADDIISLAERCECFIAVTNDIARDGVKYAAETMEYIRVIGEVNCRLAARFDEVYEALAGLPIRIK